MSTSVSSATTGLTKFIEKCANLSNTMTSGSLSVKCPDPSSGRIAELSTPQDSDGMVGVPNRSLSSSSTWRMASSRIRNSAIARPVIFSWRSASMPASITVGWEFRPR